MAYQRQQLWQRGAHGALADQAPNPRLSVRLPPQGAFVGVGSNYYAKGAGCGRCIRLQCDDASCAQPGKQAVAQIIDLCGEGGWRWAILATVQLDGCMPPCSQLLAGAGADDRALRTRPQSADSAASGLPLEQATASMLTCRCPRTSSPT